MNVTVTNLTAAPMDLPGQHVLPALGVFTGELPDSYVIALRLSPAVSVGEDDPLEPFRAEYERLTGKRADKRWSEERLFTEIEKVDDASAV